MKGPPIEKWRVRGYHASTRHFSVSNSGWFKLGDGRGLIRRRRCGRQGERAPTAVFIEVISPVNDIVTNLMKCPLINQTDRSLKGQ
jgi:hypothetical protein